MGIEIGFVRELEHMQLNALIHAHTFVYTVYVCICVWMGVCICKGIERKYN